MNQETWRQVGPVLLSILVIVAVAVIRNYSRTLAAFTTTMPIIIPLSLWIIYTGSRGDRASIRQYTDTLPLGIFATLAFVVVVWLAARAGWKLTTMLAAGYVAWGFVLGVTIVFRQVFRL